MTVEIERKFLVTGEDWRARSGPGCDLRQGYLTTNAECTVRVRISGNEAWLTVKGATSGISRREFEYAIPLADAEAMLEVLCPGGLVEKTRHKVQHGSHEWEVDVFAGANAGLVLAEVELSAENEPFDRPPWVAREVSHDARYFNAELLRHPYTSW
ncbi:MAG: CYTH domain-containing protein [Gammaproteobacteria bacterium]